MLPFVVRFVCGGAIVAAVPVVSRHFSPAVAGALVVMPVITLISFFLLGRSEGVAAVAQASRVALLALPAVAGFLVAVLVLAGWGRLGVVPTVGVALVVWFLVASPIVFLHRT